MIRDGDGWKDFVSRDFGYRSIHSGIRSDADEVDVPDYDYLEPQVLPGNVDSTSKRREEPDPSLAEAIDAFCDFMATLAKGLDECTDREIESGLSAPSEPARVQMTLSLSEFVKVHGQPEYGKLKASDICQLGIIYDTQGYHEVARQYWEELL